MNTGSFIFSSHLRLPGTRHSRLARRTPMHSFVSCLMHCVFSTKERRRLITPEMQKRLYLYLGGIARENKMKALSIGGVEVHVHALLDSFKPLCCKVRSASQRYLLKMDS